jgi:anti-sigma factor RsiW
MKLKERKKSEMSAARIRDDDLMLVNAYVDGELDAAAALAFERRMAGDTALRDACGRVAALRKALREQLAPEAVSGSLRDKIDRISAVENAAVPKSFNWRQMAASVVAAAILGSGVTFLGLQEMTGASGIETVIAEHQRSLLAASPVDVASSDHHTVKPWFDLHLALSPPVPDLSEAGFALVGGRVEIMGGKPAPTLVYKLRQHLISLTAQPRPEAGQALSDLHSAGRDGYAVLIWADCNFKFYAVSDITPAELQNFVDIWRRGEPSP